jgi:oligopeptide/dipeptide ABC transporter ATP-binding protein
MTPITTPPAPLLDVRDLEVSVGDTPVVRSVSFQLAPGERLGIVGESGSGKTLTALSVIGLHRAPVRVSGGQVLLNGTDLLTLRRREIDKIRGARISMIYQDPATSLDPLMTIGDQIVEAIRLHEPASRAQARNRAVDLLGEVGVPTPRERLGAYPHEFSGGMRQRVMIAIALACQPEVLLCDEPTTALDVTTQALVLDLLDRLCREHGVASILITHDLAVASGFCDRIAVMYAGQVVEQAPAADFFERPAHPYSGALLSASVDLTADISRPLPTIAGQPPLAGDLTAGCAFRSRCPYAVDACATGEIELLSIDESGPGDREARCIRPLTDSAASGNRGQHAARLTQGVTDD